MVSNNTMPVFGSWLERRSCDPSLVELRPVKGVPLWPEGLNTALRSEGSEFGSATLVPYGGSTMKSLSNVLVVLSLLVVSLVAVAPAHAATPAISLDQLECGFLVVSTDAPYSNVRVVLRTADGGRVKVSTIPLYASGGRYYYASRLDNWVPEPGTYLAVRVESADGLSKWIGHRDQAVTCGGSESASPESNLF